MKCELEKKILDEQSMKEKAEKKLENLEHEEIEIMKRIRTTTQVHKASKYNFNKFKIFVENFLIFFSGWGLWKNKYQQLK